MALSRHTVFTVLGLVTSVRAIPAALPEPEAQFGIGPPHYSVSWDAPLLATIYDPQDPEKRHHPRPTRSNEISLGQPSATISWDSASIPTDDPETEDPNYPEEPEEPQPHPTDIISLNPPTYSVSWDGRSPPKTTKRPWPPRPSHKTSTKDYVSASITWDKRQDSPSYSIIWDASPSPKPTGQSWPWWPPAYTSTNGYVSASVSWGKRQEDEDPEPTDFPEFPEDPDTPIGFPGAPAPTPSNTFGIQPPQVSFSWGKRQDDAPEPTDFPEFPEDPEDPFPGAPAPTPSNTFGIQPPQVSFSWGKREQAATYKPPKTTKTSKAWISWGKRQDDDGPTEVAPPPVPTPSDQITIVPPTASISWGKRQDDDGPTEVGPPPAPTPSDQITIIPPTASISWGKRNAEAQAPTYGLGLPSSGYVSWGKRDDVEAERPTTFVTIHTPPPVATACPTVTKTIVPPCVPPFCPHGLVSCKVGEAQVEEVQVREIEKAFVTVETVARPGEKPTPTERCTTSTVVVNVGCPTYTCVPWEECTLMVGRE